MSLPVPKHFAAKKADILSALSVPDESYTDLSPKGSVDEGIRDLIDEINRLNGVATTSSCAGRISVFLEGSKDKSPSADGFSNESTLQQSAVPGGKGLGGKWLFVSHDPVKEDLWAGEDGAHKLFGLVPGGKTAAAPENPEDTQLVRFQFEPMILHIVTASLPHAQRVLAAALSAGFRESGVQSLKALHDSRAFPMVAVRTAGLALSSVVGFATGQATSNHRGGGDDAVSLVSEDYLQMMLRLANRRFEANAERIARFRHELGRQFAAAATATVASGSAGDARDGGEWEDRQVRAERMRREGLARQRALRCENGVQGRLEASSDEGDILMGNDILDPQYSPHPNTYVRRFIYL